MTFTFNLIWHKINKCFSLNIYTYVDNNQLANIRHI